VTRLLALVNIAAIPYVWIRFPKEARAYTAASFRCLWTGRRDGGGALPTLAEIDGREERA